MQVVLTSNCTLLGPDAYRQIRTGPEERTHEESATKRCEVLALTRRSRIGSYGKVRCSGDRHAGKKHQHQGECERRPKGADFDRVDLLIWFSLLAIVK